MARRTTSKSDDPETGRRKVREYNKDFEIRLDTDERSEEAMTVADLVHEYDSIEIEIKEFTKPKRDRLKAIRKLLTKHSLAALNGTRTDAVRIEEFYDPITEKVTVVRADTSETLKVRKATREEVDDWIDFETGGASDPAH